VIHPHLDERTREALARAIHEDYVTRAVASQDSDIDPERLVSYEGLSEEVRESNRSQADDLAVKVEMMGATIVPLHRVGPGEFRLTPGELERLSRHEHARWMREKRQAGWRFGPTIDPAARTHPCLVGYDRLPDEEKAKDRQAVERIPLLLRALGLGIARRRAHRGRIHGS
jgi:hypothetical protein